MTQGASNWLVPLIGSGSLLTLFSSAVGFIFKQIYERQKLDIAHLKQRIIDLNEDHVREIQRLERKLEDVETREQDSLNSLISTMQSIDASTFGGEDIARIQKLRNRLDHLMAPEVQKPLDDCKKAAQWVKHRKENWVGESLDFAVQRHQSLIPNNGKPELRRDIDGYLRWLYDCLQVGHTQNRPISSYVGTPAINTSFPYSEALEQLRRKEDYGSLSETQAGFLDDFLRKLIEKVSNEFTG